MTIYRDRETGDRIGGCPLYGQLKSGAWSGDADDDGVWIITDEDGDTRVLEPIEGTKGQAFAADEKTPPETSSR